MKEQRSAIFITEDPRMQALLGEIRAVAPVPVPLLLIGESGVGKEVLGRLIHRWSGRGEVPFVPVNSALLRGELFESVIIPKMLRAYFRYDRTLLSELSRAAWRAVARFVEEAAGPGVRPAMVVVKHTFGEGVRFHPHLHALSTAGGWDRSRTWRPLPAWDPHAIRGFFEAEVFRFLRKKDLLSRERMELIRSWPHSGFNVHVSRAIPAGERSSLARVARYMFRAPLMLSRIAYDRDRATVRIDPHGSRARETTELDVLDFIARLAVQIPDPHERLVHYYGPYSNASHQRPVTKVDSLVADCPDDSDDPDQGEYIKERRIRWARLIRMVWLEDPLLCPRCGSAMRIISFITDRPVIDKILRHIGFTFSSTPAPPYRPPPHPYASPLG